MIAVRLPPAARLSRMLRFSYLSDKSMHLSMLQAYSMGMKKPSALAEAAELSLLSRMMEKSTSCEQINEAAAHFIELRHYKLLNIESLNLIQQWFATNRASLRNFNQLGSLCFFVEQGRYRAFQQYSKSIQFNAPSWDSKEKGLLARVIFNYCKSIVERDISNIKSACLEVDGKFSLQKTSNTSYQKWNKQIELVRKAHNIFIPSSKTNTSPGTRNHSKRRSNLQVEVEALLQAVGYTFQREVSIFGFAIDFLVQHNFDSAKERGTGLRKCILEVMGSHHYTVDSKLFGRDIFRALALQNLFPVGMIHACDLNPLKGVQNRMQYINRTIENAFDSDLSWDSQLKRHNPENAHSFVEKV